MMLRRANGGDVVPTSRLDSARRHVLAGFYSEGDALSTLVWQDRVDAGIGGGRLLATPSLPS